MEELEDCSELREESLFFDVYTQRIKDLGGDEWDKRIVGQALSHALEACGYKVSGELGEKSWCYLLCVSIFYSVLESRKLLGAEWRRKGYPPPVFMVFQLVVRVVISLLLLNYWVCSVCITIGSSMEPTLHSYQLGLVWKLGYEPEPYDIVIFQETFPQDDSVVSLGKRVIAVAGQTVWVDYEQNCVWVDGEIFPEPYLEGTEPMWQTGNLTEPVVVPEEHLFVLGDNRNFSTDSRFSSVGMVHVGFVRGKFYPLFA